MSGKRSLKKQQKRQASALAQLAELYRRGADDELLARAAELGTDLRASPFAAQWAEAADRALRQSLARADFGRLERLLRSLRRNGPLRPLGLLAETVLDLAAGRLDEARSRLAFPAAASLMDADIPLELLLALEALAADELDFSLQESPQKRALPQAAAELFTVLRGVEAGAFLLSAAQRKDLARRVEALRKLAPAEKAFLDGAGRCLSLLSGLDALEARLSRLPEPDGQAPAVASQAVEEWIRGTGASLSLSAVLDAPGPPLLAPLRRAVELRWRGVLERVAAREGPVGLAELWVTDPRLLEHHLNLAGGASAGQEALRQRFKAQQLLATERYEDLALLLRARSRTPCESGALAALWSLELWARSRKARFGEDEEDDDDALDLSEGFLHRCLARLGEMAGEIGRRFPAGQRREVARELRDELFLLCDAMRYCAPMAGVALALLEHQPGDPGLLVAGVAGAIAGDAPPATLRALTSQIAGLPPVNPEALETAKRLMVPAAQEPSRTLARILDTVRPLFASGEWSEVTELVAREMGTELALILNAVSLEALGSGTGDARWMFDAVRDGLGFLRPTLGGQPGFAAAELAVDCWRLERPKLENRLAEFLASVAGWEGVLAAFLLLDKTLAPWAPHTVDVACASLAQATIDRLDDRWQLWGQSVPRLAIAAEGSHLKLLEKKLQKLLASPELPEEGHEILNLGLHAVRAIGKLKKKSHPRPRQPKKRRGRRAAVPQLQIDLP
ncbi:MAG TPA: hypothetical protein VF173_22315 [Thermoanaerobaculia bacterium]|nr:hypothetical protein [Thermoanaerobaculia bacterium]